MDYWHDIVEDYDPPKIKGAKNKDHGGFSQESTVILLTYLAFGADYSSGVAEYFSEIKSKFYRCSSILTNANKIGSVLKRMNQDKLVILLKEVTVNAGTRKYYALNPQILQSPIRDSTNYTKRDGSPFKIPLETIEGFLGWLALKQAGVIDKEHQEQLDEQLRRMRHKRTDDMFIIILTRSSGKFDYCDFLEFIEAEARRYDFQRDLNNQQPDLSNLINEYSFEVYKDIRERESCVD
jgi:hypothetical protein